MFLSGGLALPAVWMVEALVEANAWRGKTMEIIETLAHREAICSLFLKRIVTTR
jgi:hypothetical protein